MKDCNELIYQKSNDYRLHADKLRWTLLAGYIAVIFALISKSVIDYPDLNSISIEETSKKEYSPFLYLGLFVVSHAYFVIVAVQNWYYNLFSDFVKNCERKIKSGENLYTLDEYVKKISESSWPEEKPLITLLTPMHPSFSLAFVIIGTTSAYLISKSLDVSFNICNLEVNLGIILGIVYFFVMFVRMIFWDSLMYRPSIKKLSCPSLEDKAIKRKIKL